MKTKPIKRLAEKSHGRVDLIVSVDLARISDKTSSIDVMHAAEQSVIEALSFTHGERGWFNPMPDRCDIEKAYVVKTVTLHRYASTVLVEKLPSGTVGKRNKTIA